MDTPNGIDPIRLRALEMAMMLHQTQVDTAQLLATAEAFYVFLNVPQKPAKAAPTIKLTR